MANWYSNWVLNQFIFGKYPSLDHIDVLNNLGIKLLVNLTYKNYTTDMIAKIDKLGMTIINFAIKDGNCPRSINTFKILIDLLIQYSKLNIKFYIHCKHGRGRSSTLAICYLVKNNISFKIASDMINAAHRSGHGQKWQNRTIPTHQKQLIFITNF